MTHVLLILSFIHYFSIISIVDQLNLFSQSSTLYRHNFQLELFVPCSKSYVFRPVTIYDCFFLFLDFRRSVIIYPSTTLILFISRSLLIVFHTTCFSLRSSRPRPSVTFRKIVLIYLCVLFQ